ncbi:MAG: hypothetical protein ABL907_23740 [Hyphomicrobium sp.]
MWRAAVFVGALLWLTTIVASGIMNAVAGYALGRSSTEGTIFAALGVAADGWKALAPIFIAVLVRERKFVSSAAAILVWAVCFIFAVTAAIGLVAQNRAATTGGQEAMRTTFASVSAELDELHDRKKRLALVRSVAELEAAIAAVFARPLSSGGTIASVSTQCATEVTRTRTACADIASLRIELASAIEVQRINQRVAELERDKNRLSGLGATTEADPQAHLIARLARGLIAVQDVGLGLVLILVCMVELVSGFGPAVLVEFARVEKLRSVTTNRPSKITEAIELRPIGDVYEFMADCVRPAPGASVAVATVVLSYAQWCMSRKCVSMSEAEFLGEFERIGRRELDGRVRKREDKFEGISLTGLIASGRR